MYLSFGLDMVIKYVFFKGKIYGKLIFMLNDFRVDLLFMHFFLIVFFSFYIAKEVDSGYEVQTITGENELHQVICHDKNGLSVIVKTI